MSSKCGADSEIDEVTMMIRTMLNDILNRVSEQKIKILSVDNIRPLPKVAPRKTNEKFRLDKSRMYTSIPEKERIGNNEKTKVGEEKKQKKVLQSECEAKKKEQKLKRNAKGRHQRKS